MKPLREFWADLAEWFWPSRGIVGLQGLESMRVAVIEASEKAVEPPFILKPAGRNWFKPEDVGKVFRAHIFKECDWVTHCTPAMIKAGVKIFEGRYPDSSDGGSYDEEMIKAIFKAMRLAEIKIKGK